MLSLSQAPKTKKKGKVVLHGGKASKKAVATYDDDYDELGAEFEDFM